MAQPCWCMKRQDGLWCVSAYSFAKCNEISKILDHIAQAHADRQKISKELSWQNFTPSTLDFVALSNTEFIACYHGKNGILMHYKYTSPTV